MDKQALLTYLKRMDEYGALEKPSNSSTGASMDDLKAAQQALNERFDLHLHSDISQDASFVGDIDQILDREHWFSMRFSKFGRLFTIRGTPQSYIDSFPVDEVIKLLEDMKFVYVPMEILELPYEGPNEDYLFRLANDEKPPLWWDRYFSYT